jgi:hypothetical protein
MTILAYMFYFIAATVAPIQRRWLSTKNEGGNKFDLSFKVSLVQSTFALTLLFFFPIVLHGSYLNIILLLITSGVCGIGYSVSYFTAQRHVEAGTTRFWEIYIPQLLLF